MILERSTNFMRIVRWVHSGAKRETPGQPTSFCFLAAVKGTQRDIKRHRQTYRDTYGHRYTYCTELQTHKGMHTQTHKGIHTQTHKGMHIQMCSHMHITFMQPHKLPRCSFAGTISLVRSIMQCTSSHFLFVPKGSWEFNSIPTTKTEPNE